MFKKRLLNNFEFDPGFFLSLTAVIWSWFKKDLKESSLLNTVDCAFGL